MGVDRYWEAQDELQQCPAKLAAANARIAELERDISAFRARVEASERIVAGMTRARDEMLSAQTLDEERVRKIVLGILFDLLPGDAMVDLADAIANRAARQLAGTAVRLDDQQLADVSNAISDLERGSRGRMPYDLTVRDILLRLLATVRP